LGWGLSGEFPINLGTEALAQQGECRPVTTITGRGSQESEPFEITGQTFRVDYEINAPGETEPGFAFFNVLDENGGIVQPDSQEQSSDDPARLRGSAPFSSGPGTYTLEILAQTADYTITVVDCSASAVRYLSQQPGSSHQPGVDRQPDASKGREVNQNRDLLKAGGPADGPVPVMPGGGCPEEYPVQENGVCRK